MGEHEINSKGRGIISGDKCRIMATPDGRIVCADCGEEFIAVSAAALYSAVYGHFCMESLSYDGVVRSEPFMEFLHGCMDDDQIERTLSYLSKMELMSLSEDGKYFKHGVGKEAEVAHKQTLWRKGMENADESGEEG